jgi:uncharacterized protein (DUF1800 family)
MQGEDQLRQRVAFALSEIFVISDLDYTLGNSQYGVSHYYNMLAENAFGNYRELLEKVTLHPTMGIYLGMARNQKANAALNIRPDENYAREVLQLFLIGLYQLRRIYGDLPSFTSINNPDDARDNNGHFAGRIIPKISVSQYGATLASWMGVTDSERDAMLPNLSNFAQKNLGFMQ